MRLPRRLAVLRGSHSSFAYASWTRVRKHRNIAQILNKAYLGVFSEDLATYVQQRWCSPAEITINRSATLIQLGITFKLLSQDFLIRAH